MKVVRIITAIVLALFALVLVIEAMTVPMIAAAGPAVVALLFAGMAFVCWPKQRVR